MSLSSMIADIDTWTPRRVDRATSNIAQGATLDLFTITGGLIWLVGIQGHITTVIAGGANDCFLEFVDTSTTLATAMCTVLDIDARPVGEILTLTGRVVDPLARYDPGVAPLGFRNARGFVLDAGVIRMDCTASVTGQVQWSIWYIPLEDYALVLAA